ncbi:hypothetical protein AEYBE204_13615 [Asticcacaulis sp. YBE204]|nr:hypothetical protein AEYBE204_13615 [Asticcacaulis sp. YBE204]
MFNLRAVMKNKRIKGLIILGVGVVMIAVPFLLTDYAFKHWSDNGAALMWVSPWGLLLQFGIFGGLFVTGWGLVWLFGSRSK